MQPLVSELVLAHRGKEEEDDRAAYYGGRVLPQRRGYLSKDLEAAIAAGSNKRSKHRAELEHGAVVQDATPILLKYEEVEDYLVCLDVNSLYPSVQLKYKYAYGRFHYWDQAAFRNNPFLCDQLNMVLPCVAYIFERCQLRVDVDCPTDLITAFLIERTPTGMDSRGDHL